MNDIKIFKKDEQSFIDEYKKWIDMRKQSKLYYKYSHKKNDSNHYNIMISTNKTC